VAFARSLALVKALITKIFGSKHERDIKKARPIVGEINRIWETLEDKPQEFFFDKTSEFREMANKVFEEADRYADERDFDKKERREEIRKRMDEYLDEILPEAFAMIKEACRRLVGTKWEVAGIETEWNMVPFDVQLIGGIVLHQGKITEMATGEGKTLVATLPLFLNGLTGRGSHLVTVNDYLAKRDREWMGPVFEYCGLTVGCIQGGMSFEDRRAQYACDITYGTNNEFGFDYLRDNMVVAKEQMVHRGFIYAIVDEVDSVLIDEARTPLIISGPVESTIGEAFRDMRPLVDRMIKKQTIQVNQMIAKGEKAMKAEQFDEFALELLTARRGAPKNKKLLKMFKEQGVQKLVLDLELNIMRDKKNLNEVDERLFFAIDERDHSVHLSEKGLNELSPGDKELFEIPDLTDGLHDINANESLSPEDRVKETDRLYKQHTERTQKYHAITQLLKAYSLFEKDVDYVLQDGKVMIVDQFTGRLMPGRRFSDGLHQAIEAKELVRIEGETQTVATITLQNYFRMYEKLAGMTGTAETEAGEFWNIYKLDVIVIPTNKPIRRLDFEDVIFRTKREKYSSVIEEIMHENKRGKPVLVGTVSVDVSETLSRLLKAKGIKHEVLNAKNHQREAEIIQFAGRSGAVTIATNMAGRGTDIKLGQNVVRHSNCALIETPEYGDVCPYKKELNCKENMPCGLHIIGTEWHESRRIDRQLRGRSGRQGDPGSSRFYLCLEDTLMRLFGSDRIASIMDRIGIQEGEVITHKMVTKAIERAQKRVESENFSIRKRTLDYDDVMNSQREVIYGRRLEIIENDDIHEMVEERIRDVVEAIVDLHTDRNEYPENWDLVGLRGEAEKVFLMPVNIAPESFEHLTQDKLKEILTDLALKLHSQKEELLTPERMRGLERYAFMKALDDQWRDHLYEMDQLRTGISLRAYGQRDPLVEYKKEAFRMFKEMVESIDKEAVRLCFWAQPAQERSTREQRRRSSESHREVHQSITGLGMKPTAQQEAAESDKRQPFKRKTKKVGRNDPCPCGSGKKYKKCCGLKE
jgi:preprotein translocase subunit SecA